MDLLHSPLHDRHAALGAKFAEFGGWLMPLEYSGVLKEHASVRDGVGVFDVSHLGKALVRGPGAADFVNACLTNDLGRIHPGKAQYTLCCDDDGGVIDDIIAYLRSDDEVFLIPNAANNTEVVARLSAAGATIVDLPFAVFARAAEVNPRGAISSAEAYWWHREWLKQGDAYDPRVAMRIRPGEAVSAADYIELLRQRRRFVQDVGAALNGCDAMLMPTTPDTAPTIAEAVASDESYFRFNSRMLRNPSLVNLFDGCALSLPCHAPGGAPIGLTLAGTQCQDDRVLAIGIAIEALQPGAN